MDVSCESAGPPTGNAEDITFDYYLRSESIHFIRNNPELQYDIYPELRLRMKSGRSAQSSKQLKLQVSRQYNYEK